MVYFLFIISHMFEIYDEAQLECSTKVLVNLILINDVLFQKMRVPQVSDFLPRVTYK